MSVIFAVNVKSSMEKCILHNRKILPCRCDNYHGECTCYPRCEVCVRVAKREHEKQSKKCNYVVEITTKEVGILNRKIFMMKYPPRKRLKPGDYAVVDYKTGYIIKAKTEFVQFYVVK